METEMYGPDRQFGNFLLTRYINTLHATENKKVDLTLTYCTLKKRNPIFCLFRLQSLREMAQKQKYMNSRTIKHYLA